MVTQTTNPLHFEDLEPHRFEDLCYQIVYRMKDWLHCNNLGACGSDNGIDIRAIEVSQEGAERVHHFQCKRQRSIVKSELEAIIDDYCARNEPPFRYYLVLGCKISKKNLDSVQEYGKKHGIDPVIVWDASYLEAVLCFEHPNLLNRFFGIQPNGETEAQSALIRKRIAMEERMRKDFLKAFTHLSSAARIELGQKPWLKFKYSDVIIRSIFDNNYPIMRDDGHGYTRAEVYDFSHEGLLVRTMPFKTHARYRRQGTPCEYSGTLEVVGCVPFERIVEYKMDGDEFYACPHLFCEHKVGESPFSKILYVDEFGSAIPQEQIIQFLDIQSEC